MKVLRRQKPSSPIEQRTRWRQVALPGYMRQLKHRPAVNHPPPRLDGFLTPLVEHLAPVRLFKLHVFVPQRGAIDSVSHCRLPVCRLEDHKPLPGKTMYSARQFPSLGLLSSKRTVVFQSIRSTGRFMIRLKRSRVQRTRPIPSQQASRCRLSGYRKVSIIYRAGMIVSTAIATVEAL